MAGRVDFIVFGASGFTGKFVVRQMIRLQNEDPSLSYKIAGRSRARLAQALIEVYEDMQLGLPDNLQDKLVEADVENNASLDYMASQAKVLLNCVGPYRLYGEQVVRSCVQHGTHHLDLSGEPQFLHGTLLKYHEQARQNKCFVVGACGFDSVIADMGMAYTKQQFKGDLNSVESILRGSKTSDPRGRIHTGTWESALYAMANRHEMPKIFAEERRLQPYDPNRPLPKSSYKMAERGPLHYNSDVNAWCTPSPFDCNSVIKRSQKYDYYVENQRPMQTKCFMQIGGLLPAVITLMFGIYMYVMAKFTVTRNLMVKYPEIASLGLVSKKGPSKKQIEQSRFRMDFIGLGWPEPKLPTPEQQHTEPPREKIITRVSGGEPGYITASACMAECGLALLKQRDQIKEPGGALTTASIFKHTNLIDRLNKQGVKFEVVKQTTAAADESVSTAS